MSEELNIELRINEIDASIEVQKWFIKRYEALKRLKENEDFQIVMLDGYINAEADRVYSMLINPGVHKIEDKESYFYQLETIKNIIRYLGDDNYKGIVQRLAENAVNTIDENERLKQELLNVKGE